MHRPASLVVACLLFSLFAFPQRDNNQHDPDLVDLQLKIIYDNSRSAVNHTMVQLLTAGGTPITQGFTDDTGNILFRQLSPGSYRVRVSAIELEDTTSDLIALTRREGSHYALITAKLKASAVEEFKRREAQQAMISALELKVPDDAKREFKRGTEAMQAGDNAKAQKHLEAAIALYPQYALAYNHLGVVYMQTNQPQKAREAFEKAVALNDHYPSALINVAKLRFQDHKEEEAEALLRKAVAADPGNAEALALLADAEIVNGRLDDALANIGKLQSLPHSQFAAVHYVAARALLKANRQDAAIAQLALYVQESPNGPNVERARAAIAQLKGQAATR